MNAILTELKKDKLLFRAAILNFSIILISTFYILVYYKNLPPFIPLFNQMPWGDQRIIETFWIFLLPGLALLVFSFNLFFSLFSYKNSALLARLFAVTSFIFSVLTLIFLIRTVHTVL